MTTPAPFRYRAWGLHVASEVVLAPYLDSAAAADVPDVADVVVCRRRDLAPRVADARADASVQRVRLTWQGLVIDVRDGCLVEIPSEGGAPDAELAQFVAGPIMGTVLTQRGYFVLHASAVRLGGEVIAFTAASGVGKSTLAVLLAASGAEYLADDIVVVRMDADGTRMVLGPRRAKVDDERLVPGWTILGREGLAGRCVARPPADDPHDGATRRLGRICVVVDAAECGDVALETLTGAGAVVALAEADFAAPIVPAAKRGAFLQRARDLAGSLPVERLICPRRLDVGPTIARVLLASHDAHAGARHGSQRDG